MDKTEFQEKVCLLSNEDLIMLCIDMEFENNFSPQLLLREINSRGLYSIYSHKKHQLKLQNLKRMKAEYRKNVKELRKSNICIKCALKNTENCNNCMIVDSSKFCLYTENK